MENVNCCGCDSIKEINNDKIMVGGSDVITIVNLNEDIIEHRIKSILSDIRTFIKLRDGNI